MFVTSYGGAAGRHDTGRMGDLRLSGVAAGHQQIPVAS